LFFLYCLIIILIFGCQIYVSSVLYRDQGLGSIIIGFLQPNTTFFRGWRQANALGIKDVMIFWSILFGILLLMLCGMLLMTGVNG